MKELKLTKPRARYTIIFRPDKDDDWFIYIINLENLIYIYKNGPSTKNLVRSYINTHLASLISPYT
jgi:hypothetical protein